MNATTHRIIYVASYEVIAIMMTLGGLMLLGFGGGHSGALAIAASTVAVIWNFIWNTLYEQWERRHPGPRTLTRRIAHSIGFEGGLIVFLVPLIALILGVGLIEAFMLELGLLVFFFVFTLAFSSVFDRVLPPAHLAAAAPTHNAAQATHAA